MAKNDLPEVKASGVVLLRKQRGKVEVCILHRPGQKDWSLPKGKIDPGEHVVTAARRETIEESGEDVILGVPLITQRYRVDGRPKSVRYWVGWVKPGGPGFKRNKEIDEVDWLSPDKAAKRLSYPRDVPLMRAAVSADRTIPLIIVRHTQAMRRTSWDSKKPDEKRPLTGTGRAHARKLAAVLAAYGVEELYSSDAVRCIDTIKPYSTATKTPISLESVFSEDGFDLAKNATTKRINQLLENPVPSLLSTHRPVLPDLVNAIARKVGLTRDRHLDAALVPGGMIVLHRVPDKKRGMRIVAVERHNP